MEEIDDNQVMNQVKNGKLSQMSTLFDRHHKVLFGYFYRMTYDAALSEDLMQNVFYRMIKYRDTYKNEGKFVYWMYAIARNVHKEGFRKKDPLNLSAELSDVEEKQSSDLSPEENWVENDRQEMLKQALGKLVEEQREAIILSKFQGLKYQEIATLAGVSENAIKARIRRGLMELRKLLKVTESK